MKTSTSTAITEEDLIKSLRRREREGMAILYDRYAPALYGVIYRIVKSDDLAEDILQETFVRVWNSFSGYDAGKGKLFTWLMNIARNLAIDKIRSKEFRNSSKNQSLDGVVHIVDEREHESFNPDQIGLQELVRTLGPEHKQIIDLIYFNGYTHTEVSEELGLPLGTVKTRLRTAIITLRQYFNKS